MKKILIRSDVAGIVAEICFNKSDFVKKGENLIFIESMKMEIPISSEFNGKIKSIEVSEGDEVDEGQVVAIID